MSYNLKGRENSNIYFETQFINFQINYPVKIILIMPVCMLIIVSQKCIKSKRLKILWFYKIKKNFKATFKVEIWHMLLNKNRSNNSVIICC